MPRFLIIIVWEKIKILFSNSELDKVEILLSYNKILSKYESELSLALSEVVYRDTSTLIKTDKGIENPIRIDDTPVDQLDTSKTCIMQVFMLLCMWMKKTS